ncbi:polymorphic toxin type 50 domain-containing protein [Helicobacter suis]|uniref:polymorphic toxin type 50 domain-containing protein n=1 Tax=Helicobacter suis TaxID=104628 RepID=UPI0013D2A344|nr:polymorphic toxin type 50 domain-containing protein [Helicobacter suis]
MQIQGTELTSLEHFKEAPPLKEGFKIQSLDFDKLAQRLPNEKPYPFTQRVLATIKSALSLLSLNEKQEKHVLDSPGYIQGRSYYTKAPSIEEVRGWIAQTAAMQGEKRTWDKKLIIEHPGFEGTVMPFGGIKEKTKTNFSKVHFSKKGIHIVPFVKGEHD